MGQRRPPRAILPCRRRQHRAPQCLNRSPGSSAGRLPTRARRRSVLRAVLCRAPEMVRRQRDTGCLAARRGTVDIGTEDGASSYRPTPASIGTPSRRGWRRRERWRWADGQERSCAIRQAWRSGRVCLSRLRRVGRLVFRMRLAWPLAGLRPLGGSQIGRGGCALHDGPAVRHRPHGRVAVTVVHAIVDNTGNRDSGVATGPTSPARQRARRSRRRESRRPRRPRRRDSP